MPKNRFIPKHKAAELLQTIVSSSYPFEYEQEKHRLIISDEDANGQVYFRLPLSLNYSRPKDMPVNYVILLVQSGNCALGYFEDGVCLNHKVFRSYMVRKKQGKSQIKYLKTKGKSRAGSRVRLGETLEFFENINERLQTYFEEHDIHRVAISCSKTLIPYLFSSKVATPFDKNDPRLFKIPKHIHTPIFEVMLDANRFLQRGELIYAEASQPLVDELLAAAGVEDEQDRFDEEEDKWDEEEDSFDEEDADSEEEDFDEYEEDWD